MADNLIAPTVTPNLPGSRYSAPQISDEAGRELSMLGHSTSRAAADIFRIEMRMREENDTLRVNAELNAMKELDIQLRYGEGGLYSKKGLDAINTIGPDTYSDQLVQKQQEVLSSLANEQQRRMFMQGSNNIISSFRAAGIKHLSQERIRYDVSVQEGTIKNALNEMPLAVSEGDEESYHNAMARSDAALFRLKEVNGWSAEEFEVKKREKDSHVTKQVVGHLLDNGKWEQAEKWLEKNKEWMSAEGVFWSRQRIDKVKKETVGQQLANQLYQGTQTRTGEAEDYFAIGVIGQESGGRQQNADGSPVVNINKNGTTDGGIAQINEATGPEAAKLAGLEWNRERWLNDKAYNYALGKAYFDKWLKVYNGDPMLAAAAYHSPKRTQEAFRKAKEEGGNWLDYADKELRDYVGGVDRKFQAGVKSGRTGVPALSGKNVSDEIARISASDPELGKIVMSNYEALSRFGKAREQESSDAAMRKAMTMLPSVGFQLSRLPQDVAASINPKEMPSLQNWAANMAKGDDVTDPAVYQFYATHPEALKQLTEDQFFNLRTKLSDADWRRFANQRAELISGKGSNSAGDLDHTAINRHFSENMRMMGKDPSPKDGTSEAAMMGARRQALDNYIAAAQRGAGRKFNDAEIGAHVSAFFMQTGISTGWFGVSREPLMGMDYSDIGRETRLKIIESLERSGIPPTEGNVMKAFILSNVTQDKG
ncbi:MAG: transglycosylase SLT domain-containing protein [Oxalobacter formigenes]|nr:transglycosylase SLT domain-containing protein [Oxalobacter formigenes]